MKMLFSSLLAMGMGIAEGGRERRWRGGESQIDSGIQSQFNIPFRPWARDCVCLGRQYYIPHPPRAVLIRHRDGSDSAITIHPELVNGIYTATFMYHWCARNDFVGREEGVGGGQQQNGIQRNAQTLGFCK